LLSNIGVIVLPGQLTLGNADKAFDDKGNLLDHAKQAATLELGANLKGYLDKFQ